MDDGFLDISPEDIDPLELIKDVEQWNAYREKYKDWIPNLERANFSSLDLSHINFEETKLFGANLQGAYMCLANLNNADLRESNFRQANLVGIKLRGAQLQSANLEGANLEGAELQKASLVYCQCNGANFDGANFEDAALINANFQKADFKSSHLKGANLGGSDFRESKFRWANLDVINLIFADFRASDLRNTNNIRFDETLIEGTLLSPNSNEPWTVLRREYTGSKLLFHLLLLVLFLIPLASKTLFWNVVSEGQVVLNDPAINELPERFVLSLLVGMPGSQEAWASPQSIWFVVNLLIISYNAARMLLTVNVGHMREELESTGTSPMYHKDFPRPTSFGRIVEGFKFVTKSESVDWLVWIHGKAQWLLVLGGVLAAANIVRWLFTTVHAPV
jgi:uncharacterized protein YjbI with pentapeptide repeats